MSLGRRAGVFAMLCVMIGMLSGCRMPDQTLVQIGPGERITVSEYQKSLDTFLDGEYKRELPDSIPFEQFRRHLEGMIENRLILAAAYEAGLDQDSTVQSRVHDALQSQMTTQLYSDKVVDKAVTENDIRNFWQRSGIEVTYRKIEIHRGQSRDSGTDTAQYYEKAMDLANRARKGEPFSRLARQYSDDRISAQRGGEMSPLWYDATGDPIIEAVFSAKEGQIVGPIEIQRGWVILSVDKKALKNRKSYQAAYNGIREYLAEQKRRERNAIARAYLSGLDKRYNAVTHQDVVDTLSGLFTRWKSGSERPNLRDSLETLPESLTSRELFTSKFKTLYVSDMVQSLLKNPRALSRGKFEDSEAIRDYIYRALGIQNEMIIQETRRLRYENHPRVVEKVRQTRESEMVSQYLNRFIYEGYETSADAVRAYYETHKAEKYSLPEIARVQEVQVYTERKVDEVLDRVKRGEDFGQIASDLTLRGGYKPKKGILPDIRKGTWGDIGNKAFEMDPGEIAVVDLTGNKFSVIKLLEKIPARPRPFSEVAAQAERALAREVLEQRKAEWLNARREALGVSIREKGLEKLWRSYQKS